MAQLQAEEVTLPTVISQLLIQFANVFALPSSLSPNRHLDHQTPLLPEAQPFKLKPYWYPHFHKIEIKQQVTDILRSGIIQPSNSPFPSPVFLVKKKDNS